MVSDGLTGRRGLSWTGRRRPRREQPREDDKDAFEAIYVVRFSVRPDGGQAVIDWLDGRHMAEVAQQPGFLWARRCRMAQDDPDGWHAHMMIYAVATRAALEAYFASDARRRFMDEGRAFAPLMRAERQWGRVEAASAGGGA